MATKVFISWGGELSYKLGEVLREWLPSVLQHVKPYFTPDDVQKGAKWDSEISAELQASNIGVICLTRDNTERPWILFEAGALAKEVGKARVCPLLFNLEPAELKGPLATFQSTKFTKDDFKLLVTTINSAAMDSKLEPSVLDSVFDKWWPDINDKVSGILAAGPDKTTKALRPDKEILMEILELVRTKISNDINFRPKFYQLGISELMNALQMLTSLVCFTELRQALDAIMQMNRPLHNVFSITGNPEIYQHQYANIVAQLRFKLGPGGPTGPTGPLPPNAADISGPNGPSQ